MQNGFNGSFNKSRFSCCNGCKERFAGDDTKPNCHKTCEKYLTAKENHEKERAEIRRIKYEEHIITEALIDGGRRMQKTKKKKQKI